MDATDLLTDAQSALVTSLLAGGLSVVTLPDGPDRARIYCCDRRAPYPLMRYLLWPVTDTLLGFIKEHGAQRGFRFYVTDRIMAERRALNG